MHVSPSSGRERVGWILVGIVIAAPVILVVSSFVGSLTVALFLYYATRPANRWLYARTSRRYLSATVTLLLVGLPILLIFTYAAYVGLQELDQFLQATDLEQVRSALQPYLGSASAFDQDQLVGLVQGNLSRIGTVVGMVAGSLLRLFIVLTVAYFLLVDDGKIGDWFRRSFEDNPAVVQFGEDVDGDLTTLYSGNLLIVVATGAIAVVTFLALDQVAPGGSGISYPILLGLLIGIGTLIPTIGMKIIYVPYTAFLLWRTQTGPGSPLWFPIVFFVVTLIVVDLLPDTVVRSYVASGDYHKGLVMLAYVLGAAVFGWYGIFLAPLLLVLFVHFARDVFPNLV
mgnify:CR=1 FL=1